MTKLLATDITMHSLACFEINDYPTRHGNYFFVRTEDDKEYRVINCNYENMLELQRLHVVKFPILVQVMSRSTCIIVDTRISSHWLT